MDQEALAGASAATILVLFKATIRYIRPVTLLILYWLII